MIRKIFKEATSINGYQLFSLLFFGMSVVSHWLGKDETAVINMLIAIYFKLSELTARD